MSDCILSESFDEAERRTNWLQARKDFEEAMRLLGLAIEDEVAAAFAADELCGAVAELLGGERTGETNPNCRDIDTLSIRVTWGAIRNCRSAIKRAEALR